MSNTPRWRIVAWYGVPEPSYWSHLLQFEHFSLHFKYDGTISARLLDARDEEFGGGSWQALYVMEDHGGRYLRPPDSVGR